MTEIFVDGDACPVKAETLDVAERHELVVHLVATEWLRIGGQDERIRRVVVSEGWDAVDDWIVEHISSGDVCITADIALARRCIEKGARALGPSGKPFTEANIGVAMAMRDLKSHLRETGEGGHFNRALSARDRSRFRDALDKMVRTSVA